LRLALSLSYQTPQAGQSFNAAAATFEDELRWPWPGANHFRGKAGRGEILGLGL
jgi:hypothetical protein